MIRTHTDSLPLSHTLRLFSPTDGSQELPFFGPLELYQRRDREKQHLCERNGIKLVTIPCWWDNKVESLAATLYKMAPSLFQR